MVFTRFLELACTHIAYDDNRWPTHIMVNVNAAAYNCQTARTLKNEPNERNKKNKNVMVEIDDTK